MHKYKVTINDKIFEVVVEDMGGGQDAGKTVVQPSPEKEGKAAPLAAEAGKGSSPSDLNDGVQVMAPLSGSIFSLLVKPGERVNKGQALLTLEALKMENEILAPESGNVSSILVNTGDVVNTGDLLMIIKES